MPSRCWATGSAGDWQQRFADRRRRRSRVAGATLLGEAAHVTAPGGEGANIAMLDGAELGLAIPAHPDDVEAAIAAYEEVMFLRSEAEAIAAHETIELIFRASAPYGLVALFVGVDFNTIKAR